MGSIFESELSDRQTRTPANLKIKSRDLSKPSWKTFLSLHEAEFVWVRFMTLAGAYLVRMFPKARFKEMMENGERLSLSCAVLHSTRNDHIVDGGSPTGVIYLEPDIFSAYLVSGLNRPRIEIMGSYVDSIGRPVAECVRGTLSRVTNLISTEFNYGILVGFEIEVTFIRPSDSEDSKDGFEPPDPSHGWSTMTPGDRTLLPMVEGIVSLLVRRGISVQQFHSESAPGQWEFVLGPRSPVEAVDSLVRAREVISLTAQQYGYHSTLHPRPFSDAGGTGAHCHVSVNPSNEQRDDNKGSLAETDSFFAGVMSHLPSLVAFTMPLDVSYERVTNGIWSGGEYVSWGWENRETPLRRVASNRFEMKFVCGTANPYVSLSAILTAGICGLRAGSPLSGGHCEKDPTSMTADERAQLQIDTKIPNSIDESIAKLRENTALSEILGVSFVSTHISITEEWNRHIQRMDSGERKRVLFKTY